MFSQTLLDPKKLARKKNVSNNNVLSDVAVKSDTNFNNDDFRTAIEIYGNKNPGAVKRFLEINNGNT